MGERELTLSIALAKALIRLVNRRAAAEQLLNSRLPLAQRLQATKEITEIEQLLNNRNKNHNIMTMLKGISWLEVNRSTSQRAYGAISRNFEISKIRKLDISKMRLALFYTFKSELLLNFTFLSRNFCKKITLFRRNFWFDGCVFLG